MVTLRSRLQLGVGTAFLAAGAVVLALAFTSEVETYAPASVEETSAATTEPAAASFSGSLAVAGGILVAAGIGVALLAFSDFGKPARR